MTLHILNAIGGTSECHFDPLKWAYFLIFLNVIIISVEIEINFNVICIYWEITKAEIKILVTNKC